MTPNSHPGQHLQRYLNASEEEVGLVLASMPPAARRAVESLVDRACGITVEREGRNGKRTYVENGPDTAALKFLFGPSARKIEVASLDVFQAFGRAFAAVGLDLATVRRVLALVMAEMEFDSDSSCSDDDSDADSDAG